MNYDKPSKKPMKVYEKIAAITAELSKVGISKDSKNQSQGYKFRGIDQVYLALSPLLARHALCILPRVTKREIVERQNKQGTALFYVTLTVEFDFVAAEDASRHTVITIGEAMDSGDKASNKAMSAAYKYAAFQAFCIPTEGDNDADATTHEVAAQDPELLAQIALCADVETLTLLFKSLPVDVRQTHMDAFQARKKELA